MSRRVWAAILAGLLVPLLLAGCGREQPAALLVGTEIVEPADREPMPPISGTTLDGQNLDLATLRGTVVVLNSWASWCGPCVEEVPALVELSASLDPADARVIGLNVSDDPAAAAAFADQYEMAYPSIADPEGAILPMIPGVPPAALPSTVVVDRQGRIAARVIGAVDAAELQGIVASVTAEPASG
ncbi:MAG: TlpA family protein disulfide reductase [Actinobacteria bacterium]|nr:TlpA family protein disulfide reductase [Actinomycetota bacterium]